MSAASSTRSSNSCLHIRQYILPVTSRQDALQGSKLGQGLLGLPPRAKWHGNGAAMVLQTVRPPEPRKSRARKSEKRGRSK